MSLLKFALMIERQQGRALAEIEINQSASR